MFRPWVSIINSYHQFSGIHPEFSQGMNHRIVGFDIEKTIAISDYFLELQFKVMAKKKDYWKHENVMISVLGVYVINQQFRAEPIAFDVAIIDRTREIQASIGMIIAS
ncbi:MAG: hypothetical protein K9M08_17675 [Pirellula sp.]|nr:hypothetical protein [Pirellula sp.]